MIPKTIFTQNPNEGFEEFHENHFETLEPETRNAQGAPETFLDWYESKQLRLSTEGETLQLHILQQCYHKILHYQITRSCEGYELSEHQLILHCASLHQQFCRNCYL